VSITAYTDADWGGDLEDRKSTTGFVVLVYGCAVSWQSKKQAAVNVALSTAKAEYMAVSQVLQEVKRIHQLMAELELRRSKSISDDEAACEPMSSATVIYTDNRTAKSLCEAGLTSRQRGWTDRRSSNYERSYFVRVRPRAMKVVTASRYPSVDVRSCCSVFVKSRCVAIPLSSSRSHSTCIVTVSVQ
jgi:hypothetical protein